MTRDERAELREIQETLIEALAKITEMLGTKKTRKTISGSDYDSADKERFIAP